MHLQTKQWVLGACGIWEDFIRGRGWDMGEHVRSCCTKNDQSSGQSQRFRLAKTNKQTNTKKPQLLSLSLHKILWAGLVHGQDASSHSLPTEPPSLCPNLNSTWNLIMLPPLGQYLWLYVSLPATPIQHWSTCNWLYFSLRPPEQHSSSCTRWWESLSNVNLHLYKVIEATD